MQLKGIDVSEHQGVINWAKVKSQIDFAILRAGYGRYESQKDKQLENNVKGCTDNNIPYGFYWYSYAKTTADALAEAKTCYNIIKKYNATYPIFFDLEDPTQASLPKSTLTNIVKAFCDYLEDQGLFVGLYSNLDWLYNRLGDVSEYTIWLAQWASKPTYNKPFGMWQYSEKGTINGINGRVDLDYSYIDYPAVIAKSKGQQVKPTTPKKTVNELVEEILAGKWGNGDERKKRLTEAGYDYNEVQTEVNRVLAKPSNTQIAKEVIQGKWGNGQTRIQKLTAAGYDYKAIQTIVNSMLK